MTQLVQPDRQYLHYRSIAAGTPLPALFLDLDLMQQNVQTTLQRAAGKPVRIASKSVRCVEVLKRLLHQPGFAGILAYSNPEAAHLCDQGLDDVLVAYPSRQGLDLLLPHLAQKKITLMVDSARHVEVLALFARQHGVQVRVCIDLDVSTEFPGLHFGVWRSGVRSVSEAIKLHQHILQHPQIQLVGVMAYEAQIAGVTDAGGSVRSRLVRSLKQQSVPRIAALRRQVVQALQQAGATLEFVNGGGTGSLHHTTREEVVTELAAGSAFYNPTLFDGYTHFHHQPALFFALEVTRQPRAGIYTCHGGGFVASGAAGPEKLPSPYLPPGCTLLPLEGAGEVQTPLHYRGHLSIGDPVFFRHAKAGELCEHFNHIHLIEGGQLTQQVPTYRGEGKAFL